MKYGRWTVLGDAPSRNPKYKLWRCRCDCGTERDVDARNVRIGKSTSCGCYLREVISKPQKHGMTDSPTYTSWQSMRQRCYYEKNIGYARYGGRGIKVCDRWKDRFENFLADMGERPNGATLDRIDVNGDYEPSNCKWASREQQNNNRRDNHKYEFEGEALTIPQIARRIGMKEATLRMRIKKYGFTLNQAVSTPLRQRPNGKTA